MDLSSLSDSDLMRLAQALASNKPKAEPPMTPGRMAAEGTGAFEGAAIGAGKGIDDLIQGAKQLYYGATGNDRELGKLKAQQEEANRNYAPLRDSNPIGTGLGEGFPAMAAMALTGGAGGLPMAMGKAALSSGLAEGAKYGTADERLRRGAVGALEGAGGTAAGFGIGKLISPVAKAAGAPSAETMQAVQNLGVQLTPGQSTGSMPLRNLEQLWAQRSGSAPVFAGVADANKKAVNRAAASAMGETADEITPGVFAGARQRMSGEFDRLTKGTKLTLGNDFLNDLAAVEKAHVQTLADFPSVASAKASQVIDDALNLAAKGQMSGEAYQAVRSKLGRKATEAFNSGDAQLANALDGVVEALDSAAGKSLTKTEQAAWNQVRKEYSALKLLEKGNVVQDGDVSQQLLKNAMQQKYTSAYKEGKLDGPLMDIARYAEGVKPLPDPGTAAKVAAMHSGPYQALVGSPLRYIGAQAMLSKPGQNWLGSGRLDEEAMRRLMQGGGLLGVGGIGQP